MGFIARKGILYLSALKYKEEFDDPIMLETFANDEELREKLLLMKEKGIDTLIVGSRGSQVAPKYGFHCFTVPFEDHDIMEATKEAEHILQYLEMTQRSSRLLKLIQNSISEGMIAVDPESRITEINNYAVNMLHMSREQLNMNKIEDTPLAPITELPAYKNRKSAVAELVTVNDHLFSVTLIPVQDELTVITFTSVQQVQRDERKLQEKLKGKGHVAQYSFKDIIGSSPSLTASIERAKRF